MFCTGSPSNGGMTNTCLAQVKNVQLVRLEGVSGSCGFQLLTQVMSPSFRSESSYFEWRWIGEVSREIVNQLMTDWIG